MSGVLDACKRWCQPAQDRLEGWVPGVPSDIVWSLARSTVYSFTAALITTKGDVVTGIKSVVITALVLSIYAVAKIFFDKIKPKTDSKKEIKNTWILTVALVTAAVLTQRSRLSVCAKETAWIAGLSLLFGYRTPNTPVVGVFTCP